MVQWAIIRSINNTNYTSRICSNNNSMDILVFLLVYNS
jgi:hypothetical protein